MAPPSQDELQSDDDELLLELEADDATNDAVTMSELLPVVLVLE